MSVGDVSLVDLFKRIAIRHRVPVDDLEDLPEKEIIEIIRGRLNYAVFRNSADWILPLWVRQEKDSRKPSKDDSLINRSHRNWVTVGGVGSKSYGIMDYSGLLTANPICGSVDFWIGPPRHLIYPAEKSKGTSIEILSPEDQVYKWTISIGPIEFTRLIYYAEENGREAIINEVQLKNLSLEESHFEFHVALRPMSSLGVEPITHLEYDKARKQLFANGFLAIEAEQNPSSIIMTTADNTNLPSELSDHPERMDSEFSTAKGLSTAILTYRVKLPPAGTSNIMFASPLIIEKKEDQTGPFLFTGKLRDNSVEKWFEFSERTIAGQFPENRLGMALSQAKAIVAMGSYAKAQSLLIESRFDKVARLISCLSRIGAPDLARSIFRDLIAPVDMNGFSINHLTPILWMISEIDNHLSDAIFVKEHEQLVRKLVEDLKKSVSSLSEKTDMKERVPDVEEETEEIDTEPIITAVDADSEEDWVGQLRKDMQQIRENVPEQADEETQITPKEEAKVSLSLLKDLIWAYCALMNASSFSVSKSADSQQSEILSLASEAESKIKDTLIKLKSGTGFEETAEPEILDFLSSLTLLHDKVLDPKLFQSLLDTVQIKKGLVRLKENDDLLSIVYTIQVAHYHALQKDGERIDRVFEGLLPYLSQYYNLPEYGNPDTYGGYAGEGCSIAAAADLLLLLEAMIVDSDGRDLVVLQAIPDMWYTSEKPLILTGVPVGSSRIRIEVGTSKNQHQIDIKMEYLPKELEVHLPTHQAMPMVKVYGGGIVGRFNDIASPYIRLVPLSDNVVLTFHK